jgi:rare lipoprotein A
MQKSIVKNTFFSPLLFLISCLIAVNTNAQQDQDPKKQKAFVKKEIQKSKEVKIKLQLDSIKKDNIATPQKELIIDTLGIEKGKFKFYKEKVHASYYADRFHGKRTASGKIFDMNKLTAAHKKLPFGTVVRVTNEANGKSVIVQITDRGPFVKGREIDLSKKAFKEISSGNGGYVIAKLEVLQ